MRHHHVNILPRRLAAALGLLVGLGVVATGQAKGQAKEGLDPAKVSAAEAMLPERPEGVGRPIADRDWWKALGELPDFKKALNRAKREVDQPLPEQTDELFLDYSKTGNRTRWQKVASARRGRLNQLVLAECLENKGRFLPAIEKLIADICAERTWLLPAHDKSLANFKGETIDIDLASSALGWQMATMNWLLGEKLSAKSRQLIKDNVRKRILDPFLDMARGDRKRNWWMDTTNNWNAVCLAGSVGAGLAQAESRRERAEFVAAADKYITNFLKGFTPDGYCSEGLGYWNYGFGEFVLLSETVRQATGGKLDLLQRPEAKQPALFGSRIGIIGGVAPAFADCSVTAKPSPFTVAVAARRLGLPVPADAQGNLRKVNNSIAETMVAAQIEDNLPQSKSADASIGHELRTWFSSAGILISRPAPGSDCVMGVALKGGNNNEHHNHNDLGSYVVVIKDRPVLLDPGAETYTARTFSNKRYDSKLLNSFGHPVPVVAHELQRTGAKAQARVISTRFTDETDTFRLDLSSAYPTPSLTRLERTFVYSRKGKGSLTITDDFRFSQQRSFGTALITRGQWRQLDDKRIRITDGDAAVDVAVDSGGAELKIEAETIKEDAPVQPTRIGLNLAKATRGATITLTITPAEPDPAKKP